METVGGVVRFEIAKDLTNNRLNDESMGIAETLLNSTDGLTEDDVLGNG